MSSEDRQVYKNDTRYCLRLNHAIMHAITSIMQRAVQLASVHVSTVYRASVEDDPSPNNSHEYSAPPQMAYNILFENCRYGIPNDVANLILECQVHTSNSKTSAIYGIDQGLRLSNKSIAW